MLFGLFCDLLGSEPNGNFLRKDIVVLLHRARVKTDRRLCRVRLDYLLLAGFYKTTSVIVGVCVSWRAPKRLD